MIRSMLALVALLAGVVATVHSLARVVARDDAVRALTLAPGDGQIVARAAEAQFLAAYHNTRTATRPNGMAASLARQALRQEAIALPAVVTLGLDAQLRGNTAQARRWFAYSQLLSRRDIQTQLWAIEDAVERGDVSNALTHYDIALRTSKAAPDLLYPVLAMAMSDSKIRSGLVAMLTRRPTWAPSFIDYLAESAAAPRQSALLFLDARAAGVAIPTEASAKVTDALVKAGATAEAWRYYAAIRFGARRNRSRDPRFVADPNNSTLFDWRTVGDGVIGVSIQRGFFDFAAPPSASGVMLQQTQVLPPGRYRLEAHSTGIVQPATSLPFWRMACGDGREIGRFNLPPSVQQGKSPSSIVVVPANCPIQNLTLVARGSSDIAGVSGRIDFARIVPVD